MLLLKALIACCVVHGVAFAAGEWSYSGNTGPNNWNRVSGICGQQQQSPINIYEGDVKEVPMAPFEFRGYTQQPSGDMTMENNGHTVRVNLAEHHDITLSGGGLPAGTFQAAQLHFHWGNDAHSGSEHVINSKAYPMELHVVHYNTAYGNLRDAVNKTDGLAVLGFMYELADEHNSNYSAIVNNLIKVASYSVSNRTYIPAVALSNLLPDSFKHFYRYSGSLTTPNCYESVKWTIFKEPIKISNLQMNQFRTLSDSHNHSMVNNSRPVQELNNRMVVANFQPKVSWTYSEGDIDAEHWHEYYSKCGGEQQSPINIVPEKCQVSTSIGSFIFHNYGRTSSSATIKNNGHTANVYVNDGNIRISEGGLTEDYKAYGVHFHWGSHDKQGSEHTVDGFTFPLEVHIVHFRSSLETIYKAIEEPDGLAVVGFFARVTEEDNPALNPIIDSLASIRTPYSNTSIPAFTLGSILPKNTEDFYRYNGSLTTPGCFQSVIWTVLNDTITISSRQLNAFGNLKSSEKDSYGVYLPMVDNFRPTQDLKARVVLKTFSDTLPAKTSWSYHSAAGGDKNWANVYKTCATTPTSRQSPIDIQPKAAQFTKIEPLRLSGYNSLKGLTMQLSNNGHTAKIYFKGGNIVISGGGLEGEYKAAQLHLHWGASSGKGSEHRIDGKQYPAEVHIVHYSTKYKTFSEAAAQPNGLAVLGFFYEISDEDNPNYETIIEALSAIKQPYTSTDISPVTLSSILPCDMNDFFRYSGSLTVPACSETVVWTVFKSTIQISEKQLNTFRSLLSVDVHPKTGQMLPLVDNYRQLQAINNRKVQANFIAASTDASSNLTTNAFFVSLLLLLLQLIN
jgi:carbonic anhydrase